MAGVPGFEPGLTVLETAVLTIDTIPLHAGLRDKGKGDKENEAFRLVPISPPLLVSLRLFVRRVFAAEAAVFFEFQPRRRCLFIFIGDVVAIFAITALQNDVVSHNW